VYGYSSYEAARSTNNMGDIFYKMGDHSSAIIKFQEAIHILEALYPGYLHPTLAAYKNNLAEAYIATNQPDSALIQVCSALDLNSRSVLPENGLADTIVLVQTDYLRSM